MSGRSPSNGVASLRARFEHSGEKTSPPSRGRSPAGSFTSESSRPLSKVRTNFVPVEPSGKMEKQPAGGDAIEDPAEASGSEHPGKSQSSGIDTSPAGNPLLDPGKDEAAPPAPIGNLDGLTDDTSNGQSKALADQTSGLGSILKGSPFEESGAGQPRTAITTDSTEPASKRAAAVTRMEASMPGSKAPGAGPEFGKPREKELNKPAKSARHSTPSAPLQNGEMKGVEEPALVSERKANNLSRLSIEQQKGDAPRGLSTAAGSPPIKRSAKSASSSPRTPGTATSSAKRTPPKDMPVPKAASPKIGSGRSAPKMNTAREATKPVSRAIAASKPVSAPKPRTVSGSKPTSTPSTSAAKPPAKKTGPSSPSASAPIKPKPRSPTRPQKLPGSATAPTAASAAKLDGIVSSSGDQRSINVSSLQNSKGLATQSHIKSKVGRTSLPGGSQPATEKSKPKPRASMANTKGNGGGFLERMMRPTQSSAQKTHEKVEPKSPPRKTVHHPPKPKRASDIGHGHGDVDLRELSDKSTRIGHPGAETSEGPTQSSARERHDKFESTSLPTLHFGNGVAPEAEKSPKLDAEGQAGEAPSTGTNGVQA